MSESLAWSPGSSSESRSTETRNVTRLPARVDACIRLDGVGTGVPALVMDYPLGRLLEEEGAALQCERSPEGIARGIGRLLSEEGRKAARRGMDLAKGRLSWDLLASSWLEQV